ncbi:MAG: cell envelope integrity protein CreD [Rhodothermaceae bacterium]|nr:cell envelope integrity protein CreD [Rhodothermaceae bacterium]MXZ57340.1 cell envelope integrity protein CreD [Rhodothermaceae bacterium]MYB90621.1 cell envelope integrity protein CreD [Rhodothermaceae bacterium]MYD68369.1 cell envelope integrity protein CreD [Rhodothermaceae bacterium]MYG44358.1 cell envelope integrity protein CreD [Rhodothermaceae bacterium]
MAHEILERLGKSIELRLVAIALITLILMIPVAIVGQLILDRSERREETLANTGSEWSEKQTLLGPVMVVPYSSSEYVSGTSGESPVTVRYAFFLPDSLTITGTVEPEIRYRGIYQAVLYSADLTISGSFPEADFSRWSINEDDIRWQEAFIALGITDMRGIKDEILVNWSDTSLTFVSGMQEASILAPAGVSTPVTANEPSEFSFSLGLNGNDELMFIPVGKTTRIDLSSSWPSPSFRGAFLPDERTITEDGFSASWQVLDLNRAFGQSWRGESEDSLLDSSAFGVSLYPPIDQYRKTQRSTRYGFLLIGLTLLAFFLTELRIGLRAHPFQYILVGLDLVLFFLMLLALGEHMAFDLAYILSSIATIGLAALYARAIYRSLGVGLLTAGILAILYTFIFLLLQLQDYALLAGSIGLFLLLAITMYLTRNFSNLSALARLRKSDDPE